MQEQWAKITTVGLEVYRTEPEPGEWVDSWQHALKMHQAGRWALGDLWNYRKHLPDEIEASIRAASIALKTVQNYAWVARQWPYAFRRPHIDFTHHAILAALPIQEKVDWLDKVEREDLTTEELRASLSEEEWQAFDREMMFAPMRALRELIPRARKAIERLPAVPEKVDVQQAAEALELALDRLAESYELEDAA